MPNRLGTWVGIGLTVSFLASAMDQPWLNVIRKAFIPGSGEIFVLPNENNLIVVEKDVYYGGWTSTIPSGKLYERKKHRGTDHYLSHRYDTHVPLVLLGDQYIWKGTSGTKVSLLDVVPTLGALLSSLKPAHSSGRVLKEALKTVSSVPKIAMLVVLDQGGMNLLKSHRGKYPFIEKAISQGFSFEEAHVDFGPASTSVSHAVLGTGALPRYSRVTDNRPYHPEVDTDLAIYSNPQGFDVLQLGQPTLADLWDVRKNNASEVWAYSSASRAVIGMAGHGSAYQGGDKDVVFWYDERKDAFVTDETLFQLPAGSKDYRFERYKALNSSDPFWKNQTCAINDKPLAQCLMGSPAFTRMEGDLLFNVLSSNKVIGADSVTDLVLLSFKGTDYCGHYMGSESLECGQTLYEIDRQISRLFQFIRKRSGGDCVLLITADHGVAPLTELSGGSLLWKDDLKKDIEKTFNKKGAPPVVKHILRDRLHLDLAQLESNGHDLNDIKSFLSHYKVRGKPFFKSVATFREVDTLYAPTNIRGN